MKKSSLCITLDSEDPGLYMSFSYPGGERQVRLTDEGMALAKSAGEVNILARIHNPQDVLDTILLGDAVNGLGQHAIEVNLILPYMPYSRADRRFVPGDCYGLGSFLNLLSVGNFDRIITLDLHSDNQANVVNNVSSEPIILKAIARFAEVQNTRKLTVLFPDEGAAIRYGNTLPASYGNNHHSVMIETGWCVKKRDAKSGKLSGFEVPEIETDCALIVDDICDGGGTFLGIADALAPQGKTLGLYVSHGIFSQGFEELNKRFLTIYTTNSFKDSNDYPPEVVVFDCLPLMLQETADAYRSTVNTH